MKLCLQRGTLCLALLGAGLGWSGLPSSSAVQQPDEALSKALAPQGLLLDRERGLLWVPCVVDKREELLEYLLVGPQGAAHESLLLTEAQGSLINAALLALGVEPGLNARWIEKLPRPSEDELRSGVRPAELALPEGDAFLLYLAWKCGTEYYLFRVEDLISNLRSRRSMERHPWVYLGSRFVTLRKEQREVFAADFEQNLINIAFFYEGNSLLTAALSACEVQTIWVGNSWLLPESNSPVGLIFARQPLLSLEQGVSAEWLAGIPEAVPPAVQDPESEHQQR